MFMIGSIKKIFASIFGIFGAILKLPLNLLSSKKDATAESAPAKKQKKDKSFYLEASDAKGVPAATAAPQAAPKSKKEKKEKAATPVAATATALNLPQPTVTVAETSTPVSNYKAFGPRRRPGANMKSYLDMAKTIKSA
jgi:hypothetical protein